MLAGDVIGYYRSPSLCHHVWNIQSTGYTVQYDNHYSPIFNIHLDNSKKVDVKAEML